MKCTEPAKFLDIFVYIPRLTFLLLTSRTSATQVANLSGNLSAPYDYNYSATCI